MFRGLTKETDVALAVIATLVIVIERTGSSSLCGARFNSVQMIAMNMSLLDISLVLDRSGAMVSRRFRS